MTHDDYTKTIGAFIESAVALEHNGWPTPEAFARVKKFIETTQGLHYDEVDVKQETIDELFKYLDDCCNETH